MAQDSGRSSCRNALEYVQLRATRQINIKIMRTATFLLAFAFVLPSLAFAQDGSGMDEAVISAMSAGPLSISANARIIDWEMNEIRPGSNSWTCLPDNPGTDGKDPWCVNEPWLGFLSAMVNKTEPEIDAIGFAYMLSGDSPVSNSDPFAKGPTGPEDWVTNLGAHLMMLVPDPKTLEGISTDHLNGGPWVMFPNTPYAHIMIPIDSR
jgi:hypothetical protein